MMTASIFASGELPMTPAPSLALARSKATEGIGERAVMLGVSERNDKTSENAVMARSFFTEYPNDRLLPMPTVPHSDWPDKHVEFIREMSERLAATGDDLSMANLWRANLTKPRSQYSMDDAARRRVVEGAERRAAIRAGRPATSGLTERGQDLACLRADLGTVLSTSRRKSKTPLPVLSLSDRFRLGHRVVEIFWSDPRTTPPCGLPRTAWAVVVPLDVDTHRLIDELAPIVEPGSGWTIGIGCHTAPRAKWTEEAKGRVRRANLRRRLDKAVPLFASMMFDDAIQSRPDYFAGKPPEPAGEASMIGHNGGPPLKD